MNTQFKAALIQRERMQKIKEYLSELDQRLWEVDEQFQEITEITEQSYVRTDGIWSALSRIFVKKDSGPDEQELEARHKLLLTHRQLEQEIRCLTFEKSVLQEQLDQWPEVQKQLENIRHRRELELQNSDCSLGNTLRRNNRLEADLRALRREIQEVFIQGSRLAKKLRLIIHEVKRLSGCSGVGEQAELSGGYPMYVDFPDALRRQLQSLGQHFLKFDAAIFELYRVHGRELPTNPDRYSHCNPGYFTNLSYQSELQDDPRIIYHPLVDLCRRGNDFNQGLRLKIRQIEHQIKYLEEQKNRLLEEDLRAV